MKRRGITLLEVLMAIFIMGIGMMSVFALFPVAALMMGQSIERYQINETISVAQSNFDPDGVDFVKNHPEWIYSPLYPPTPLKLLPTTSLLPSLNFFNPPATSSAPLYLFLDQAAGTSGLRSSLGGTTVAYVNPGGALAAALVNERFFTLNYDIELDESGRAVTPVSAQGKYSISFFLEKKPPLDNPLPSRRYMLVYKGRSQSYPDFPGTLISGVSTVTAFTVPLAFSDGCKRGDWLMVVNSGGERTFHKVQNINSITGGGELEVTPKFGAVPAPNSVYLLQDVVRVIDLGAG